MSEDEPESGAGPEAPGGDEPYAVGYGKPPKDTRFKPGNRSGKGRPKGAKNLATMVKEALGAKVPAKINGKTLKLTKIELSLHQLANKASAGDQKAIARVIELYQQHGPQEPLGEIGEEQTAYDLETIAHHIEMNGVAEEEDEGDD